MNTATRILPFALAFLATAPVFADEDPVYAVRTCHPEKRTIAQTLVKTGSLESPASVDLCAKVAGRLDRMDGEDGKAIVEGSRVAKDSFVFSLDDREYKARFAAAEAEVASAEVSVNDAVREHARTKGLFDDGAATRQELDRAETDLAAANAGLARAKAQLDQAKLDLGETEVRSPMNGVVSKKFLHPGAMVSASTPVCTIVQTDPLRLLLDIPTTAFPLVDPGKTTISATVDAYPNDPVKLVLDAAYPTADAATRTITVRAMVPNPDGKFAPGMFVRGEIALNERPDILVVPMNALLRNVGHYSVYKVKNGVAHLSPVEVGLRYDDVMEIVSGVEMGDELVTDGMFRLADGSLVNVVQ